MRKVQSNLQQRSLAFQQVCIFSFKWTEPWILAGNWYPAKYPFSFTVWCGHPTKLQTMRHIGSRCDFFLLQNFWEIPYHTSAYVSFSSESNAKECSNYRTNALISHTSKVNLKVLQARLQQYINHELPDIQAWFRKGRGTRDQIANIHWIIKKAREFQKSIYLCFIDYAKAFDCVDHNKLWKILKEMGIPDHLTCLLRNLYAGQ